MDSWENDMLMHVGRGFVISSIKRWIKVVALVVTWDVFVAGN